MEPSHLSNLSTPSRSSASSRSASPDFISQFQESLSQVIEQLAALTADLAYLRQQKQLQASPAPFPILPDSTDKENFLSIFVPSPVEELYSSIAPNLSSPPVLVYAGVENLSQSTVGPATIPPPPPPRIPPPPPPSTPRPLAASFTPAHIPPPPPPRVASLPTVELLSKVCVEIFPLLGDAEQVKPVQYLPQVSLLEVCDCWRLSEERLPFSFLLSPEEKSFILLPPILPTKAVIASFYEVSRCLTFFPFDPGLSPTFLFLC